MDPEKQRLELLEIIGPYKYEFQLERGLQTGQDQTKEYAGLHFQGWLSAEKRFRPEERFAHRMKGAHWEYAGGKEWNARSYTHKDSTRVDGPWTNCDPALPPQAPLPPHMATRPLRAWQQDILDRVAQEPDSRTVLWYWSPLGNIGKSDLAAELEDCRADTIVVTEKAWDAHAEIHAYFESEGRYPTLVVIDCERGSSYILEARTLESIKNGRFTLTKGSQKSRKRVRMAPPHVLVLANEPPSQNLSTDRWHIVEVA